MLTSLSQSSAPPASSRSTATGTLRTTCKLWLGASTSPTLLPSRANASYSHTRSIHREGQKRTCVIYRFLTVGTIDEVIYQRQITKQDVSEAVMVRSASFLIISGLCTDHLSACEQSGRGDEGQEHLHDCRGASCFPSFCTITRLKILLPPQLRNLFTLHDDVACQTHELLECRCHFGEIDEDEEDEPGSDESESEDDGGGFMQASQYQDGEAARQVCLAQPVSTVTRTNIARTSGQNEAPPPLCAQDLDTLQLHRRGLD